MTRAFYEIKENMKKMIDRNDHLYDRVERVYSTLAEMYLHHKADVCMISFPKCGRTWLRLMMGKYIQRYYELDDASKEEILELRPLSSYDKKVPNIRVTHDDDPQFKKPDKIEEDKIKYKNKKIIFLVRDPRDVVVSLYYQFLKRRDLIEKMEISDFIKREEGSLKSIIKFYNVWWENKHVPEDFLKIRYENLHTEIYEENRFDELKKALRFIGFDDIDDELVEYVSEYAAFDNMRKMEEEEEFESDKSDKNRLSPADKEDEQSYKTRKGKVGGYRDDCDEEDMKYMDELIEKRLYDAYDY